jgi:hypothetical protein
MTLMIGVVTDLSKKVTELAKIVREQNRMIDEIQDSQLNQYDVSDLDASLTLMIRELDEQNNE